jgi:hypothetical protein
MVVVVVVVVVLKYVHKAVCEAHLASTRYVHFPTLLGTLDCETNGSH